MLHVSLFPSNFAGDFCPENIAQYNRDCSEAWNSLTIDAKAKLSSEAKALNNAPINDLPAELRPERQRQILRDLEVLVMLHVNIHLLNGSTFFI